MYNSNPSSLNFLENVRSSKGPDDLRYFFIQLSRENPKRASSFLNDRNLQFPTLFILRKEIEKSNLSRNLSMKNKAALTLIKEILSSGKSKLTQNQHSFDYVETVHSALKWILKSGAESDGMNDEYDHILDIVSIILIKIYKDRTILPTVVDMIFKRYKKRLLIHDLLWGFFQSADPGSLMIIGEKLLSKDKKDAEIACKLLNFIPNLNESKNSENKYPVFLSWMKENAPFLEYTGESFQQTPNPKPYKIVLEGKYLCKNICCDTGRAFCTPSEEEYKLLDKFKDLDHSTKVLLSNFSFRIHSRNIYLWNIWRHTPIDDQVKIARIGGVQ